MDVLIVDGNNLAHRCRHVFKVSYQGHDTSVRYGFLRVLLSKISQLGPDIVIVCWDGGVPQYRYDRCPTYKARDRSDDPDYDVFLEQMLEVQTLLSQSCGVTCVQGQGIEADDLMYHAAQLMTADMRKTIFTGDKDLLQAVVNDKTGNTVVLSKDTIINQDNFEDHSDGVPMEHWMDYRAMVGDSSDGYPGLPGVGPVNAKKLLDIYGTHTAIVNAANDRGDPNLPAMSPKMAEKVRKFGLRGFQDGYAVMRLDVDRFGARRMLQQAFGEWQPFDHGSVRAYVKRYMMVSLLEGGLYRQFGRLLDPSEHVRKGVRVPVMLPGGVRAPVEVV
jgi:DNA polymerase-1